MKSKIKTVVFPVAGLGTRFYPATKVTPKELLVIVDKPIIHYAVQEAIDAGMERFILVTNPRKKMIERYFDINREVTHSEKRSASYAATRDEFFNPSSLRQVFLAHQSKPLGDGHAVWCARTLIGQEPFAVIMPDDVIHSKVSCLAQLVQAYEGNGGNWMAVRNVSRSDTNRYGIIDVKSDDGHIISVKGMVEKPEPASAPSTLAITGRYIFQPEILASLKQTKKGYGGEIQLTDAMAKLSTQQPFFGLRFEGNHFDCGNKFGLLEANMTFAYARPDVAPALKRFLHKLTRT